MTHVLDALIERDFVEQMTSEDLRIMLQRPMRVYCGVDPTADGLHLGNLVPLMGLAWFQRCGHTPVVVIGGATGMIGDPSGKNNERQLLGEEDLAKNVAGIRRDLECLLDFDCGENSAILLNNFDWMGDMGLIPFLRDVGKQFRVGPMLAKDSVKSRLSSEEGMSFTEFSYQLFQGYDFLHLFKNHHVRLEVGGSDQWGNITAGTDLVRKTLRETVYGLTFPLLTRSDGQKFGKSESGTIWLSPQKLSPYQFYQYLVRIPDADVVKLMKLLTFMDMEEIRRFEEWMKQEDYPANEAQRHLAEEVTRFVHGEEGLETALRVTATAAPGAEAKLDARLLEEIAEDMPNVTVELDEVLGKKLVDVMFLCRMTSSKGEARRLLRNGGVYLNNQPITDESRVLDREDLIEDNLLLLGVGKKKKCLVRVTA